VDNRAYWYNWSNVFQKKLEINFWNDELKIMNQCAPYKDKCNEKLIYWWHAHVLDVILDAYKRTGDEKYKSTFDLALNGTISLNGGTLLHNWYDDMEWMALALLRAYDTFGDEKYKESTLILWEDIKTAWNCHMGGGMAWKKDQLDYKNTPANAPAAILAARLYKYFGKEEDLEWSKKIYNWNKDNLVDPKTGFVWDGLNRLGDGEIDKDWKYTYCQGVFLGAGVELYKITKDESYLQDALKTTEAALKELIDANTGMLPDEGIDDAGLFKGIFVRYLIELLEICPNLEEVKSSLVFNGERLIKWGIDKKDGLASLNWSSEPNQPVQLSTQLSAVMLIEMLSVLESRNLL
jgi:predicted alpha-1,6-mannanase (GH76 family)